MTQFELNFDEDEDFDFFDGSMTFEEYDMNALDKCFYPVSVIYSAFGLLSEAGEVADKLKKFFRDNDFDHVSCDHSRR